MNKLFYVLGVSSQDFVLEANGEKELWDSIEKLQLEYHLLEKKRPKKKYKKVGASKVQYNTEDVAAWDEENKPRLREIKKQLVELKKQFRCSISANKDVKRELLYDRIKRRNGCGVSDGKKVTISDSTLTRTLGLNKNRFNPEVCIIRVYYTGIMESLIKNGFTYDGYDYVFFSASAGQTKD